MRINNLWLSFDLSLVACVFAGVRTNRRLISHDRALYTNLHVRIQIKYIAGCCFHNDLPK